MENKPAEVPSSATRADIAAMAKTAERAFGEHVRLRRQRAELSQADFAARMTDAGFNMHQTTVAKIEKGIRPTSVAEAVTMAALLGTSAAEILNNLDNKSLQAVRLMVINTREQELRAELDELRREASDIMKILHPHWDENDFTNGAYSHSGEADDVIDQETP